MRPFFALMQLLLAAGLGFAVVWAFSDAEPDWAQRPLAEPPMIDLTGVLPQTLDGFSLPEPTALAAVDEIPPTNGAIRRIAPPFNGLPSAPVFALALEAEPLRLAAEQNEEGVWIVGYGRRLADGAGRTVTREEAAAMLREDVARAEDAVQAGVRISLSPEEYAALVEFARVIGPETFGDTLVATLLNAEDREAAANAMMIWSRVHIDGALVDSPARAAQLERVRTLFLSTQAGGV
jgi:lysozyme